MKLVDFFIVGAMRSGTSSLRDALRNDSRLSVPKGEPDFFSRKYDRGIEAYHALFDWENSLMRGEKSPTYSVVPHAAERLASYNPRAKIIWTLRNPTKRAISHYQHARFRDPEVPSLDDALAAGEIASTGTLAYIHRSEYYKQIEHWLKFFPWHQQHVVIFEEMVSRPRAGMSSLYAFLGLELPKGFEDPDRPPFPHSVNKAAKESAKSNQATEATAAHLAEILAPSIDRLEAMLERKIPAWR